jgi:hypothetical protein
MEFLDNALWWVGNLMIAFLLYRAWIEKLFARYPYFFGYLGLVGCTEVVRLYLRAQTSERTFAIGYWVSEFLTAIVGFGVTWQIYATILARYGGVRRMARAVLGVFFALVVAKALVELTGSPIQNFVPTTVELERNLRFVQALLLMAIAALVVRYSVPMGRNIRSMLVGYGFYIGCAVIALSLRSQFGVPFEQTRTLIQRLAYLTALTVWCAGLWSYAPNPVPDTLIEVDYDRISAQTSRAFGRLREHVIQSWRP